MISLFNQEVGLHAGKGEMLQNGDGLSLFYFLFVVFIIRIITRSLDRVRENLFSLFCFLFCKISVCRVEETLPGDGVAEEKHH